MKKTVFFQEVVSKIYQQWFLLIIGGVFIAAALFISNDVLRHSPLQLFYTNSHEVSPIDIRIFLGYCGMSFVAIWWKKTEANDKIEEPTISIQKIPIVDGVRGLAAIGIILFHWQPNGKFWSSAHSLKNISDGHIGSVGFNSFVTYCYQLGDLTLGSFVIVSAIGLSLGYYQSRASGTNNWRTFYTKRILRIFPLYWASIFVSYSIAYFHSEKITFDAFVSSLLLLSNFSNKWYEEVSMVNGPLWFIPYLFTLYLMFPLLIRIRHILGDLLFCILAIGFSISYCNAFMWIIPFSRIGEFCIGISVGAWLLKKERIIEDRLGGVKQLCISVVLLLVLIYSTTQGVRYGLVLQFIEILVFIFLWNISIVVSRMRNGIVILSSLALCSYASFLIHSLVLKLLPIEYVHRMNALFGLLFSVGVLLLAYPIARVEQLMQRDFKKLV